MQYLASIQLVLLQNLFWWIVMTTSLAILLYFFVVTTLADITITSRSQWGATPPKVSPTHISGPVPWVIIHHSEGNTNCSGKPCKEIVRNIQHYHMYENYWADIGYNFMVAPTGEVFEGRGWGVVGAHAPRYNSKSVGICLIGSFQSEFKYTYDGRQRVECGRCSRTQIQQQECRHLSHRELSEPASYGSTAGSNARTHCLRSESGQDQNIVQTDWSPASARY
uniref:Peptidoglycan-recognition protein n=1 Tax=Homalodisca liturata TaxID=320908 RepID=A0A1B6IZF3_9HEMI